MSLQKQRFLNKKTDKFKFKKHKLENIILKKKLKYKEKEVKILLTRYAEIKKENESKLEFITNLTHEIKTPLTAILGFTALMTEKELSKTKRDKFFKNILCSSKHILKIVEYTLETVKADADKIQLEYSNFSSAIVINEVLTILEEQMKMKNIIIQTDIIDTEIIADKRRFKQLIFNLVDNAIKFNKINGIIQIRTQIVAQDFIFQIKDNGIGIPKEEQHKIFELFFCIKGKEFDNGNSTGVGLSLCKKIVKLHKGKIDFSSQVKEGSCFWFSIPKEPFLT